MKRHLLILALCGAAYAGDYADQLDRIEEQQEQILRRMQSAEADASLAAYRARCEADRARQWEDLRRPSAVDIYYGKAK